MIFFILMSLEDEVSYRGIAAYFCFEKAFELSVCIGEKHNWSLVVKKWE